MIYEMNPDWHKRFSSSPKCQDQLWRTPSSP